MCADKKQKDNEEDIEKKFRKIVAANLNDSETSSYALTIAIVVSILVIAFAGGVYWKKKDEWFSNGTTSQKTKVISSGGESGTKITITSE